MDKAKVFLYSWEVGEEEWEIYIEAFGRLGLQGGV